MSVDNVRIGRLQASLLGRDGHWRSAPLRKSPFFQSLLRGDAGIFNDYNAKLVARDAGLRPYLISWAEHLQLVESVRAGFRFSASEPATIFNNVIYDGQHRLSALMFIHGPFQKLEWRRARMVQTSRVHYSIVDPENPREPDGAFDAHIILGLVARESLTDRLRRGLGRLSARSTDLEILR